MEIAYDPSDAALDSLIKAPAMEAALHGLIQPSTGRLMALSTIQDTIMTLAHTDGVFLQKINKPTLGKPALMKKFIGWPWEWQFNNVTRVFEHNPRKDQFEEHYRIRIVTEKAALLDIINNWISNTRHSLGTSLTYQNVVREKKVDEAQRYFSDQTQDVNNFPYLLQNMKVFNLSIVDSANSILNQKEKLDNLLLETENIRLKYSKAARDARSIAEVRALYFDFLAERHDSSQYSFVIS